MLEPFDKPSQPLDYDVTVNDILFSNNGKLMLTVIEGGPIIWDLENPVALKVEAGCITSIESIEFSQDDKLLMIAGDKTVATSAAEGRVCIWETQSLRFGRA